MKSAVDGVGQPTVTILIPHYKTLELTKLCLRSLNKFTDLQRVKIVVIDNGSKDESTQYLKTLDWITLLLREPSDGTPSAAHTGALDMGLGLVDTPYVLSIHTDTVVISAKWLDFLLSRIEAAPDIAGVGSWKLEQKSPIRRFAKTIERFWQKNIWYPLLGKGSGSLEGEGENYYYLRSHCALYKTDLVREHTEGFGDEGDTAGKVMHQKLVKKGYRMEFIPAHELTPHVRHLNHATMILNPEIAGRRTGSKKSYKRLIKEMQSLHYESILRDASLDK